MERFTKAHILRQVFSAVKSKEKVVLNRESHEDADDVDASGFEKWGSCDFWDSCMQSTYPVGCYTFVELETDRFQLCPWCVDVLKNVIAWRVQAAILLSVFFPKDLANFILDLC